MDYFSLPWVEPSEKVAKNLDDMEASDSNSHREYEMLTLFREARAVGASFDGACLRGADLRGADLRGAHFNGAELSLANFRGARNVASTEQFANVCATHPIIGLPGSISIPTCGTYAVQQCDRDLFTRFEPPHVATP
jgi:hypothetical protein